MIEAGYADPMERNELLDDLVYKPRGDKLKEAMVMTDKAMREEPLTVRTGYSHSRYNDLVKRVFEEVIRLSIVKGGEYSGDDDRLANFRRNAEALDLRKEQVWAIYAAKHWDAVMQFVKDMQTSKRRRRDEPIEGRVLDLIVYLLLFRAMLDEAND